MSSRTTYPAPRHDHHRPSAAITQLQAAGDAYRYARTLANSRGLARTIQAAMKDGLAWHQMAAVCRLGQDELINVWAVHGEPQG